MTLNGGYNLFPYVKQPEPGEFRHLEAKKTGYLENPVFLTVSRECTAVCGGDASCVYNDRIRKM